ncbi:hypothetical protein [Paracraurococcus lichenis]|uniref:Uncharacterized protein n=1 Tax=Paracraurococcus lichenis TaxID=3064888 RepID=A0ABT9ECH2_9PROT|nr:hypothetical protein [Paracraurococcus sp. LOR1-02]MDO9713884.1 hypothetical protein [Paracraurococcus sp. LOR1-02]
MLDVAANLLGAVLVLGGIAFAFCAGVVVLANAKLIVPDELRIQQQIKGWLILLGTTGFVVWLLLLR